jgi:hypothetical protein
MAGKQRDWRGAWIHGPIDASWQPVDTGAAAFPRHLPGFRCAGGPPLPELPLVRYGVVRVRAASGSAYACCCFRQANSDPTGHLGALPK